MWPWVHEPSTQKKGEREDLESWPIQRWGKLETGHGRTVGKPAQVYVAKYMCMHMSVSPWCKEHLVELS